MPKKSNLNLHKKPHLFAEMVHAIINHVFCLTPLRLCVDMPPPDEKFQCQSKKSNTLSLNERISPHHGRRHENFPHRGDSDNFSLNGR